LQKDGVSRCVSPGFQLFSPIFQRNNTPEQGLFVIVQTGETVQLLNDKQFQPKHWSPFRPELGRCHNNLASGSRCARLWGASVFCF
jgi:hypothetical protein